VLKKFAFRILDYIGTELSKNTNSKFIVEGHTDNTGDEDKNIELSQERAKSVYYYLISKYPLAESRFTINGLGSSAPIGNNLTEKGRQKNRRVEVIIEK
jgi:OOP family OmpA-OmpF porin